MNYQCFLDEIHQNLKPLFGVGELASYIPGLANVDSRRFGIALMTSDGACYCAGDSNVKFSIQSISKVFSLALAMRWVGDDLWYRCGREPSGSAFNSLVQLEHEAGIPRNPFINAGALVTTDIILSSVRDSRDALLDFVRELADDQNIYCDESIARAEVDTGYRNAALAHFMKSFDNLQNPVSDVLEAYSRHCAIEMSCEDLAAAGLFLANGGLRHPGGDEVVSRSATKYLNAIMLTCGTYDAAGDFAYRVGLPAKSGVGGGILATLPGSYCVCVWSPGLDHHGNSLLGVKALEMLTTCTAQSIF